MRKYVNQSYDSEITNDNEELLNEITEESPAKEEQHGPETKNGIIVNALTVKVRKEPSMDSEVLEVLEKDKKVTIMGKIGDFYKVSTDQHNVAYIFSKYVKEE